MAPAGLEEVSVAAMLDLSDPVARRRQDRIGRADHRLDAAARPVDVRRHAQVPQRKLEPRDGAPGRTRAHEGAHGTSRSDQPSHDRGSELPGGANHEDQE